MRSHSRNVPESPQRHVQSLPRPNTTRLEVAGSPAFPHRVSVDNIPKRSASLHVKSHSTSSASLSLFRKSSADISPVCEKVVFDELVPEATTPLPCPPVPDRVRPPPSLCLPNLSNSSSSLDVQDDEKLEILSDCGLDGEVRDQTPVGKTPVARNLSNITENRSSTQSAPGNLESSPESFHTKRPSTEARHSDLSRTSTCSSAYSDRIRRLRGRQARETEGVIRPGKVAAILHRFSSTNRGSIRSVYYDSNSDGEDDAAASNQRLYRHSKQSEDFSDIDHLSLMLDETLEDLEPSG